MEKSKKIAFFDTDTIAFNPEAVKVEQEEDVVPPKPKAYQLGETGQPKKTVNILDMSSLLLSSEDEEDSVPKKPVSKKIVESSSDSSDSSDSCDYASKITIFRPKIVGPVAPQPKAPLEDLDNETKKTANDFFKSFCHPLYPCTCGAKVETSLKRKAMEALEDEDGQAKKKCEEGVVTDNSLEMDGEELGGVEHEDVGAEMDGEELGGIEDISGHIVSGVGATPFIGLGDVDYSGFVEYAEVEAEWDRSDTSQFWSFGRKRKE